MEKVTKKHIGLTVRLCWRDGSDASVATILPVDGYANDVADPDGWVNALFAGAEFSAPIHKTHWRVIEILS